MSASGPWLVVSVHDVSPATATQSRRWVDELDRRGLPGCLLVVPGPWRGAMAAEDPALAAWLRDCVDQGHEIVLHGWDHTATPNRRSGPRALLGRLGARGCAEFWALSAEEARRRAELGLQVLAAMGLPATGFTPPGWLASAEALDGLRRAGLTYTTSHTAVIDLHSDQRHPALAVSHRPGGVGAGPGRLLVGWGVPAIIRRGRAVRLALHPDDLGDPRLVEASLLALDAAADAAGWATTYGALVTARRTWAAGVGP